MNTSLTKKIQQELLNGINILLVTGAYWLCWEYFYETQLRAPFYHWGNLIMVFLFGLFYYFTSHLYNGFTLHISRIYELVYSQALAAFISDVLMYLITLLVNRVYISPFPFMPTFLMQFLLIVFWSVAAHQWYFHVFPPKKTVVILGQGQNVDTLVKQYGMDVHFDVRSVVSVDDALANLPGTLQGSEIAKFAVVLVFAHIISLNHDRMQSFAVGVLPFALVLGVVAALMLLEPHLSGTLLILGIGAVLMFVGGTGLRWFVLAGVGGAGAIAAAVVIMPDLVPYAADRLRSWQDPFADPLGDGHQTIQSLYAIGSGGAAGLGLGNSRQKHLFVPEPQNDFIFSIVCEELGFIGACAVVGLFVLLLWRGITIAARAPDRFGALLVVGFVVQVALQAVLNVAVVTNTIPNTGISLPFFSSGGTSLMMLLGEMGIVLSVSRGET